MVIFGDIIPLCCLRRKWLAWKLVLIDDSLIDCMGCGLPAYVSYSKEYNGFRGFCMVCGSNWAES